MPADMTTLYIHFLSLSLFVYLPLSLSNFINLSLFNLLSVCVCNSSKPPFNNHNGSVNDHSKQKSFSFCPYSLLLKPLRNGFCTLHIKSDLYDWSWCEVLRQMMYKL